MEDAMVLNKSSYERGFAHGSIYKAQFVNLEKDTKGQQQEFGKQNNNTLLLLWLN